MMDKDIQELRDLLADLEAKNEGLIGLAKEEDRDLTDEEVEQIKETQNQWEKVKAKLERELVVAKARDQRRWLDAPQERRTTPQEPQDKPKKTKVPAQPKDEADRGFESFGEFAHSVFRSRFTPDPRLSPESALGTTYASEGSGADGGFAVPPTFNSAIMDVAMGEGALLPYTDNYPVEGNTMTFPVDESTAWGSTGVRAYWTGEGAQGTKSTLDLEGRGQKLNKLMALVDVTDELLEDTSALDSWLTRKAGQAIQWKVNDAIVNGAGVGMPLGFRYGSSLVSQAKDASQTADTITALNIGNMYARMPSDAIGSAVWLLNPGAFGQIITMTLGDQPIWIPPNQGLQNAPNGLLLGRPLLLSGTCQVLGDAGDIYFASLGNYITITKAGGIRSDMSVHLHFDYDASCFRFVFRMDGAPWLRSAITLADGTTTQSHYVNVAARA